MTRTKLVLLPVSEEGRTTGKQSHQPLLSRGSLGCHALDHDSEKVCLPSHYPVHKGRRRCIATVPEQRDRRSGTPSVSDLQ